MPAVSDIGITKVQVRSYLIKKNVTFGVILVPSSVYHKRSCYFTASAIILKNSGDIAASFFGAHNPDVVRVLEKSLKGYFKGIKKELRKNYYDSSEEEIKIIGESIPDENKWSGEQVPDLPEGVKPSKIPATKVSPVTKKEKPAKATKKTTKEPKATKTKDEVK